jgi:hypothetical protein
MHREPNPKNQAKIVRRAFAEHGVELPHRQALDVIAQIHGHNNWQVMQALQSAVPAQAPVAARPATVPAGVIYPVPPTETKRTVTTPQAMTFEAMAFVETREKFNRLLDDETGAKRIWEAVKDRAIAFGFTDLNCVYVSEDEGQDDEDIKVFVGVVLVGNSIWHENQSAPLELAELLEELAISVCCDKAGNQLAYPDDWEVLDAGDAD